LESWEWILQIGRGGCCFFFFFFLRNDGSVSIPSSNRTFQPPESTVLIKPPHPLKSIPISFEGENHP